MIRQLIVFFIFLSSAYFFLSVYIPRNLILLLQFASTGLMAISIVLSVIYDRGKRFKQHFGLEVSLILLSVLFAMFGAYWGHNQGFMITAWVQTYMYFYFFYFFLHMLRIRPEDLEKMLIYMSLLYMVFFIIQYVMYPRLFFDVRAEIERGTIRIFLPGKAFVVLMYFYFLQAFFKSNNPKYVIFCVVALIITLLQGTRSALFLLLLGTIINLLFSKKVKSKLAITFLMMLSIIPVFYIFQDIFVNLIEVSESQAAADDDDIRTKAMMFFLTDFYPNKINYIIGNGDSHMSSPYGLKVFYYKITYGFYQSDIGIIGEYTKYGILYVISMFLIVRKILVTKIDPKYSYFKYYIFISLLGMVIGGIFSNPNAFIVILSMLYIIDVSLYEQKEALLETKDDKLQ